MKGVTISYLEGCIEGKEVTELVRQMLGTKVQPECNSVNDRELVLLLASEDEAARLLPVDTFSKGRQFCYTKIEISQSSGRTRVVEGEKQKHGSNGDTGSSLNVSHCSRTV